jgi:hypothetical protein
VQLTSNIGSQAQSGGTPGANPPTAKFAQKFTQIIFQAPGATPVALPAANTGNIYLVKKGYTKANSNGIIAIIAPGQTIAIPNGCMVTGGISPDDIYVDSDNSGEGVYATGIRGV